jgi:hypothetical protein
VTARSVVRVVGGVVAVSVSAYLVWFAVTGLRDSPPDAWFYVVALALVPWILAFAIQLPDLVAPLPGENRTDSLFAPAPAALFSTGLFVCTIALAVATESWAWGVVIVAAGFVLALENFNSMGRVARRGGEPATERQVVAFAGRWALFLIAFIVVFGAVGHVLLGSLGLLLALALIGVGLVWSIVSVARGMSISGRRDRRGDAIRRGGRRSQ